MNAFFIFVCFDARKCFISGFHHFHNPYGALNVDRQFFGIPAFQLAAVFFALVAFGGVAAQNGVGDIIQDIIGDHVLHLYILILYRKN